jgi:DNA repair exonuclease SbcCD ATPase subunit
LTALREEVARHEATEPALLELKEDPAQIRAAYEASEKRRADARVALKEVDSLWNGTDDAMIAAETSMAALVAERTQVDAVLGPEDARAGRERVMQNRLRACETALAGKERHLAKLRRHMVDLESAEASLKRARSVEEAAGKEAATLRETIAGLNGRIKRDSDDAIEEEWRETADALDTATKRVDAFRNEVAVLDRLRTALETARSAARDLYLTPVLAELRPLLGLLFDDVSVTFDEKTLLPRAIMRNGQEEDVERLSGGMREQLSILTRLAFARLLARDGKPAPVVLDDALVYSDDDRIEKMFVALHRQARDQQIIVFSCRQRAFSKLGGNVLRIADWLPAQ